MLKLYELKTFYFLYHNVKYVYTQHKGLPIHLLIYLKERVGRGTTHSKSMEPNVTKCRRGSSIHQTCRAMNWEKKCKYASHGARPSEGFVELPSQNIVNTNTSTIYVKYCLLMKTDSAMRYLYLLFTYLLSIDSYLQQYHIKVGENRDVYRSIYLTYLDFLLQYLRSTSLLALIPAFALLSGA